MVTILLPIILPFPANGTGAISGIINHHALLESSLGRQGLDIQAPSSLPRLSRSHSTYLITKHSLPSTCLVYCLITQHYMLVTLAQRQRPKFTCPPGEGMCYA